MHHRDRATAGDHKAGARLKRSPTGWGLRSVAGAILKRLVCSPWAGWLTGSTLLDARARLEQRGGAVPWPTYEGMSLTRSPGHLA